MKILQLLKPVTVILTVGVSKFLGLNNDMSIAVGTAVGTIINGIEYIKEVKK